jgi:hypothetical protein
VTRSITTSGDSFPTESYARHVAGAFFMCKHHVSRVEPHAGTDPRPAGSDLKALREAEPDAIGWLRAQIQRGRVLGRRFVRCSSFDTAASRQVRLATYASNLQYSLMARRQRPSRRNRRAYSGPVKRETRQDEHARLQGRTDELKLDHAALALDVTPFNKVDHDKHTADLQQHHRDLEQHKHRKDTAD